MKKLISLTFAVMCNASVAAPETFKSNPIKGSLDEFSKVTVKRDCQEVNHTLKCKSQEITISDKENFQYGKFNSSLIPKNADGSHKATLATVYSVDEDTGGGDVTRYFMLHFVPQNADDIQMLGNQMVPNFYEVIVDSSLNPIKGMKLQQGEATSKWLEKTRAKAERNGEPLIVNEYINLIDY